ncbi:MAG: hypothetical protein WC851_00305 [Candidatus Shapirobacteria bacterium]|jgi:hypothetical protein
MGKFRKEPPVLSTNIVGKVVATEEGNLFNGEPIQVVDKASIPVDMEEALRKSQEYAEAIRLLSARLGVDPLDPDGILDPDEFELPIFYNSVGDSVVIKDGVQKVLDGVYVPKVHSVTQLPVINGDLFVYVKKEVDSKG